VTLPTAEVI